MNEIKEASKDDEGIIVLMQMITRDDLNVKEYG